MSYSQNRTFVPNLLEACRHEGVGPFARLGLWIKLRRADDCCMEAIERGVTSIVVEAAKKVGFPVEGGAIVDGIYVRDWITLITLLIAKLPEILAFIQAILDMFQSGASKEEVERYVQSFCANGCN